MLNELLSSIFQQIKNFSVPVFRVLRSAGIRPKMAGIEEYFDLTNFLIPVCDWCKAITCQKADKLPRQTWTNVEKLFRICTQPYSEYVSFQPLYVWLKK